GEPKISRIRDSLSDCFKCFSIVVTWPGWFLNGGAHAAAPSSHHIRDMGNSSMWSPQTKTEIMSAYLAGKSGKEVNRLEIAPHFIFHKIKDRHRVVAHRCRQHKQG